jgi:hypothetical protein
VPVDRAKLPQEGGRYDAGQLWSTRGLWGSQVRVFRYLVYLNKWASGKRVVKTIDLCDQKTAP